MYVWGRGAWSRGCTELYKAFAACSTGLAQGPALLEWPWYVLSAVGVVPASMLC